MPDESETREPKASADSSGKAENPERRRILNFIAGALGFGAATILLEASNAQSAPMGASELRHMMLGVTVAGSLASVVYVNSILSYSGSTRTSLELAGNAPHSITSTLSNSSTNIVAVAQGCSNPGDGGGGLFYWDTSSASGDNGGTILVPSGQTAGRWVRVYSGNLNVLWFGADPTGISDCATAIANAIAVISGTGGTVEFPAGTYAVKSTISITGTTTSNNGILLTGLGSALVSGGVKAAATIKWEGASGGTVVTINSTYGSCLRNLVIEGNSSAGIGLQVICSTSEPDQKGSFNNFTIQNVTGTPGTGVGAALWVGAPSTQECSELSFTDFWISNCVNGIYQTGNQTGNIWLSQFSIQQFSNYGAYFDGGDVNMFRGNFEDGGGGGPAVAHVYVDNNALWCRFRDNYHEVIAGYGYLFPSGSRANDTHFSGVRILASNGTNPALGFVNFLQTGPVTAVGCEWDTTEFSGGTAIYNYWKGKYGYAAVVQEIGCNYEGQSRPSVGGAGQVLYNNRFGAVGSGFGATVDNTHGQANLVAGTTTITTPAVLTGASVGISGQIFLSYDTIEGTPGILSAAWSSVGTDTFVIKSSSSTDTSLVNWMVVW